MTYTAEAEYQDAMAFESTPYNSFATADAEAHYLFAAGFVNYCLCSRCEAAADAAADAEEAQREWDAMSREEQDACIAAEEARKAERDALAEAGDPWNWGGAFDSF